MNVRLIAVTQPLVSPGMSAEDLLVFTARVSNPSNQLNLDTGPKLLRYCIRNRHWSVFEQASMTVEIETSRAIAQQILRHRSFSFQEFSQRYATATGFEPVELRKQGAANRQGGEELFPESSELHDVVKEAVRASEKAYRALIDAGVAKECARMVLPLCTETRIYMTGSVRSWIHYFQVRCDLHAQKEHREIAEAIRTIFWGVFPVTAEALWKDES